MSPAPKTSPAPHAANDSKTASLPELAFRSVLRSFGQIQRVMGPYFASHGISASQWGVMRVLHRANAEGIDALRLTDLSERLLISPPSVTGVIDRLQRDGLVARATQANDLRVRRVKLTPKGTQLVDDIRAGHPNQIKHVLAGLDQAELKELLRLHEKMAAHLALLQQSQDNSRPPAPAKRARTSRQ